MKYVTKIMVVEYERAFANVTYYSRYDKRHLEKYLFDS